MTVDEKKRGWFSWFCKVCGNAWRIDVKRDLKLIPNQPLGHLGLAFLRFCAAFGAYNFQKNFTDSSCSTARRICKHRVIKYSARLLWFQHHGRGSRCRLEAWLLYVCDRFRLWCRCNESYASADGARAREGVLRVQGYRRELPESRLPTARFHFGPRGEGTELKSKGWLRWRFLRLVCWGFASDFPMQFQENSEKTTPGDPESEIYLGSWNRSLDLLLAVSGLEIENLGPEIAILGPEIAILGPEIEDWVMK